MPAPLARGVAALASPRRRRGDRGLTRPPIRGRAALAAALTIPLLSAGAPGAASDHPPLSEWPIAIGSGPVDIHDNDGRGWQEPGRWSARDIRRTSDGHLRLTLRVTPAPVHLPVRSGPAVLFVGVSLQGGMGDVGYERTVRVTRRTAPACRRDPCSYRFRVDADLSDLPAIAAAAPIDPSVRAAVGFTLVRTFGDGTWLQVMRHLQVRPSRAVRPGRPLSNWENRLMAADIRQRPTRCQIEVLHAYIAAGSITAAAHELGISESTTRQHLSGLYRRTGCLNAAQAAYRLGSEERDDDGSS